MVSFIEEIATIWIALHENSVIVYDYTYIKAIVLKFDIFLRYLNAIAWTVESVPAGFAKKMKMLDNDKNDNVW